MKVAIIGAGMAGLVTALQAQESGAHVTLLEKVEWVMARGRTK